MIIIVEINLASQIVILILFKWCSTLDLVILSMVAIFYIV